MTPDEPINFDFAPEPPVEPAAQGGTSDGVRAVHDAGAVGGAIEGATRPDQADAGAGAGTNAGLPTSTNPAVRAGASAPLPPIPDFRAASYPFAMASRFQAQAVIPAPKASPRQRLLYGILAALVSVIVAIGIVAVFRMTDPGAGR
jgi:hypothetical protein